MAKKRNQDICIIGTGRFGSAVIGQLSKMDCSLLLVDSDEHVLNEYKDVAQKIVVADATNIKALKALNIAEMDTVVVAVSDNIEIVAALLELNVKNLIVRAKSKTHARVLKQIGANVIIQPEYEAGVRTALIAANPNFMRFSQNLQEIGDNFVMGTTSLNSQFFEGKPIKEIKFRDLGVSVVLIKRGARSILPSGLTTLERGDLLTLIGKVEDVTVMLAELNK
ncbi:potassium channel family protein [Mycoplasmopsis bovis]|uniref:Potassium transporter, Trk family n=1 Tax=Mycoplasmopsis bovis (strain ATCC 25523 / DSM 22781 / NCTC 10131 / PG45) TaxID=289397 RepID=A0A454AQV5_MYCBG|nr:TrkA family potassium uptake protein [Mycoplasmopsis bovis]ADR25420.1 potassium transporter, Trk family [Mycoplasmopsis bovis PG45]AXJ68521.1 TrkA family potassium uptake protein [Mycoplasmopsis bovis]AXJ74190.1 TrkA family potassium uptake protein [Mycoplasmopsis bovis]MBT1316231.1 TrkA family potassium uptake protein [Mycoplasmopsis bovis]MBT1317350.1 TrkA family potassium uptake protein [Mycoplasmopsis bovis]